MSDLTRIPRPRFPNALLVVAKRPAPGRTKTRLTPPLSPQQACALYECFLKDTLDLMRKIPSVQPVIAYLPAQEKAYFNNLAPDFELLEQAGSDLGSRLDHALTQYLTRGYGKVVIMNSDGPTLPSRYLEMAFETLEEDVDVVLGPCDDGGYYLIGLKQPAPRLLWDVPMSTTHVTSDTLALAAEMGLQTTLLPCWYDVDDLDSLARLIKELDESPASLAPHTRAIVKDMLQSVDF
jgi:rSAM/selenodomain-associated transferase 1